MPLPVYLALITFAPAGCGVLIAALGLVLGASGERPTPVRGVALGLATLGALIPAVGLLLFAPSTEVNSALWVTLFGGSMGERAWLSAAYRLDGFGLYAALGIALIVAPLLLWMAWQHSAQPAGQEDAEAPGGGVGHSDESDEEAADQGQGEETGGAHGMRPALPTTLWGGLALALAVETAMLTLVFSDNVLWMALAWTLLAALAWGLGEIGNPLDTLDWPGLALMLAGPVLWALIFFIPAFGGKGSITIYPRFTDMMGRGAITPLHALALALALALAAGAYPFLAWVRGRAALITPAGLAALALATMPAALFVGARLYSAAQDVTGAWQEIGKASPPITGGIFFTLVGAVTVAIAGLMALERRDSRALIAYLAIAQAGWGFVALGTGAPAGITGLVVLLATSTFGLGAMLAAIYASGTLTSDLEPDAAGPRAFGTPIEPVRLAAWCVGALAVVGAPLCAGFVGRHLIADGAIEARGLLIPLTALAWAGDALLGLALLRATAPAFTALLGIQKPAETAFVVAEGTLASTTTVGESGADMEIEGEEAPVEAPAPEAAPARRTITPARALETLSEAPAVALALLAVIVAVAPQLLLVVGAIPAVGALLPPGEANTVAAAQLGYSTSTVQALPTLAWGAFVIFFALRIFLVPGGARQTRPIALAGDAAGAAPGEPTPALAPASAATTAPSGAEPVETQAEAEGETEAEVARELAGLPEPVDAWADLGPAFRSAWTLPGAEWLVRGVEEESSDAEAEGEDETGDAEDTGAEPEDLAEPLDDDEQIDEDEEQEQDGGADREPLNGATEAAGTEAEAEADIPSAADTPGPSPVKSRKRGRAGDHS
ncbi:MAG TPA: proton-conducting transporter membrane subunit [Ktedonobacterales bacterium]